MQETSVNYKETPIKLTADFLEEKLWARREWGEIFQILKQTNCQPRVTYPAKLSFTFENEIRKLPRQTKL